MQPLELLPPAAASTNSIEESSSTKNPQGKAAPDGEFGRLMERAMSPDEKSKDTPDHLPRKGKTTTASVKGHSGKTHADHEAKAVNADGNTSPITAGVNLKAKAAANQTDAAPTVSKETTAADLSAVLSIPTTDTTAPLPVFLSMPLMEHPGLGKTDAGTMVLPVDFLTAQPTVTTDVAKALPTMTSTMAIAAVGKIAVTPLSLGQVTSDKATGKAVSGKLGEKSISTGMTGMEVLLPGEKVVPVDSQKSSIDTTSPALTSLIDEAKASQPVIDAKTLLSALTEKGAASEPSKTEQPTTTQIGDAAAPSEPVKAENPAMVQLDRHAPAMAANIPADDAFKAVSPVTAKLVESLKNDGTGVAITASSMKNSDKTNKVAGLDVQVLPSGTNGTARETVLPAHATVTAVRSSEKQTSDFNLPLPSANPAPVNTAETANIPILPSLTDARMRDVERTHDLVSVHALRVVESKSDLVQVVIKPGGGTELSLELRHRNGTVEAEATLQHGDYQLMNQHWPDLQAKMEQRGIKLAPLGSETDFSTTSGSNTGTGNFSRQQPSREEAAQQASAFAEFTVAMNRGGATARLAPVIAGGWESWA